MFHNNLEGNETAASRFNNAAWFDKWRGLYRFTIVIC